ncbi:Protein roadkill, partial [Stegodyphus mimosarum]
MRHYKLNFLWYNRFGWRGQEQTKRFGPSNAWNLSFCPDFSLTDAKRRLCLCRQKSGLKVKLEGYLITKSQGFIAFEASMDKLSTFVFLPIFYSTLVAKNDPYVEINFDVTEMEPAEEVTNANEKEVQTDGDFSILSVPDKPIATIDTNALTSLSRDMQIMYKENHHSDFTLICGSEKFHVHKCVLSVRSPVFASMFQHSMIEATENRMTITDIDAFVLEQLVLFIYTGSINELSYSMARDL